MSASQMCSPSRRRNLSKRVKTGNEKRQCSGRRRRRGRVLLLAYLTLSLLIMFGGCADRLILFPSTQKIPSVGITRVEIPPTKTHNTIEVWSARSPGAAGAKEPQAYCLEFVGNASRGEWMAAESARQWGAHPVEIWAVNYPGYGGSPGPARLASIPPAALSAYDRLAAEAKGKPIFLVGQSLGTAVALHVAAQRSCAGMILTNPPPLRSLILGNFGWWNLWLLAGPVAVSIPSELDSVANATHVNAPAIFVLAGRDSIVPPKYQTKVFDAYRGPKQAIRQPEADHNDPLDAIGEEDFAKAVDALWSRTVASTAPSDR
jgi:pimeloyl-ACP methyl ester carboxylesterase